MADSFTLLNAEIGFLDTRLALIHVPLEAYPYFVLPILQLLFHNRILDDEGNTVHPSRAWTFWHAFINISITSNECSIVCPRKEADELFAPIISGLDSKLQEQITISKDDYSAIIIGGEGLEAGQRVLDLTGPLALAGIPIFFITSYWSDFILVPLYTKKTVIRALEERGFVFQVDDTNDGVAHMTNPSSPLLHPHGNTSMSYIDSPRLPSTPPPSTVTELQERTFKLLTKNHISPTVDSAIDLVTCAGVKDNTANGSTNRFVTGRLEHGLMRCISSPEPPRFFSLTLTATDSASLTMERRLLQLFPEPVEDILLGKDGSKQVPITLDLGGLPLESTGIVCGVSSRLIESMKGRFGSEPFDVSYLSTASAGHVIVYDDELEDAMASLRERLPG